MKGKLKVTKVRYFKTRNGLGYECKTNIPNVVIWNDGHGGPCYIDRWGLSPGQARKFDKLSEWDLVALIDEFEGVKRWGKDVVQVGLKIET